MSKLEQRCRQQVWDSNYWHKYPCSRRATRDGYCKQHHPETVAARNDAKSAKWEAERRERFLAQASRTPIWGADLWCCAWMTAAAERLGE